MTRQGAPLPWTRFAPPRASEALRARVLASSRPVAVACPLATRADRIWFSRRWRLSWLAALAVLVALEVLAARPAAILPGAEAVSLARDHEADGVAVALGLPPGGWLGARVVSGEGPERDRIMDLR